MKKTAVAILILALAGCRPMYVPNQPQKSDMNKSVRKVCNYRM